MKPVLLIGEAMGENEARIGKGFVGPAGIELLRLLHESKSLVLSVTDRRSISGYYDSGNPEYIDQVWLSHPEFIRTNVFQFHPPGNDLRSISGPRDNAVQGYGPLVPSKYLAKEYQYELDRLGDEILAIDPNLVVCLGNTALWALTGSTGISKYRGTTIYSTHCVAGYKLLACYHPSGVLHDWSLRPTTIFDLSKIINEREFPDVRRPACAIWTEPTLEDVETFTNTYIKNCSILAVDIETSGNQITCIGFAPRSDLALVVPFYDSRSATRSYWPDAKTERRCWELIRAVLEDRTIAKVFQNGLYDMAFLLRSYGIRTYGATHDTMLLHHALQPEALKGLGYLGSIYTDHGPWKSERPKTETIKRDE